MTAGSRACGTCVECDGDGVVIWTYATDDGAGHVYGIEHDCPVCHGTGREPETAATDEENDA